MPEVGSTRSGLSRIALVAIVVGCVLRLTGLEVHSFWYDEGITMHVALAPDVIEALRGDRHPPLAFWAFRVWAGLGGESDAWLRALPALVSCISLVLFAGLARRLLDEPAATAAIAILALSPFHVWHGQEVRMYAFVECATVLTLLGAVARPPALAFAICLVGSALATGSHYMGILAVAAAMALVLWARRAADGVRLGPRVLGLVLGAAVWIPWWATVVPDQLATDWGNQLRANPRDLVELPIRLLLVELDVLEPALGFVAYLTSAAILVALMAGAWTAVRDPGSGSAAAAILALVPVLAALALARVLPPNFTPKYLMAASPGVALLVGAGALALRSNWVSRSTLAIVLLGCTTLVLLHRQENHREDFRFACTQVAETWRAGDTVLVITGTPAGHSESTVLHYLGGDPTIADSVLSWDAWEAKGRPWNRLHVIYRSAKYAEDRLTHVLEHSRVLAETPERFRIRWLLLEPERAGEQASDEDA